MKNTRYILATLVLVFILVYTFVTWQKPKSQQPSDNNNNFLDQSGLSLNIQKVGASAFGTLIFNTTNDLTNEMAYDAQGLNRALSSVTPTAMMGNAGAGADSKMIAPDTMPAYQPTYYQYVYQGDEFNLSDEELAVLKRIKDASARGGSASGGKNNFGNFNLGLLNLNSFKDAGLNNFNIVQDQKFGYSLYVNIFEGSVSLSENWEKWYDQNYVAKEFKNTDIPADETIIALTDNFLSEHNINRDLYAQPEVQKNNYNIMLPMVKAENASMPSIYPVSNSVSVIYPLLIEGKKVYDDWGNKQGLQLNVNLEFNKVSSLYNLNTQNYQSSNYKMETDKDKIFKFLRNGSIYPYYNYQDTDAKIVEIPVGTPKLQYVHTWQYKNNTSDELLVPALVFPILNPQNSDNPYKTSVVIPLAKDIIDQAQNQDNNDDQIRVMGGVAE